jgi:hypothetical protein
MNRMHEMNEKRKQTQRFRLKRIRRGKGNKLPSSKKRTICHASSSQVDHRPVRWRRHKMEVDWVTLPLFLLLLASHFCHQTLTPRTAARPSSLRSVPSGFPRITANTQNKAAVHTASSRHSVTKGERARTMVVRVAQ